MALNDQQIELIMRHIDGDLNADEKRQYEALFDSSKEFRQEVLEAELIVAGINAMEKQSKRIANRF